MTYERQISQASKRLENAHVNSIKAGMVIKKERAQAKEAVLIAAEIVRNVLKEVNDKIAGYGKIDIQGTLYNNGLTQQQ